MDAIFISYRREDTEGQAGRLFGDLTERFGSDSVFMDVAGIEPGRDFRRVIEEKTASCSVLLALIGRRWLDARDAEGRRRLDDPNDFVRLETASALRRDIAVIPVLVQGARMPREDELSEDLKALAFRNGVELTHARWDTDLQHLLKALEPYVAGARASPPPTPAAPPRAEPARFGSRGVRLAAIGLGALLLLGGGYAVLAQREAAQAEAQRVAEQRRAAEERRLEAERRAAAEAEQRRIQSLKRDEQLKAHLAGSCRTGYVWRQANAADKVCVTPDVRALTAQENQLAASRRDPRGGAYGPNTCLSGFVWREAFAGDLVCVPPASRDAARAANAAAASRVVPAPA